MLECSNLAYNWLTVYFICKLENVAVMPIAMYCHLRPTDAIAFPT